jgi:GTPase
MTVEIGFVVGDVLDGRKVLIGLELQYPINEQERVAVRQQAQHLVDIHGSQGHLQWGRTGTDTGFGTGYRWVRLAASVF